jgi:hypothetical protein
MRVAGLAAAASCLQRKARASGGGMGPGGGARAARGPEPPGGGVRGRLAGGTCGAVGGGKRSAFCDGEQARWGTGSAFRYTGGARQTRQCRGSHRLTADGGGAGGAVLYRL